MTKAKLIEKGVYGVDPAIEGKRLVQFSLQGKPSWWNDTPQGMYIKSLDGTVLKVVENAQTPEEALKSLGYEIEMENE